MLKQLPAFLIGQFFLSFAVAQQLPDLLSDASVAMENYLPDYSYAGYHYGEEAIPDQEASTVINVGDYGVVPDDGLDDSKALQKAFQVAHEAAGPVTVLLPSGQIILSEILYIEQSNLVLRGAGSGENGTVIFCPRPMKYFPDPPALQELREYLVKLGKRQREPENNIDLPFSQYAWSGGVIWTRKPGTRTKAYLEKYDEAAVVLAKLKSGNRGANEIIVSSAEKLSVGDVVQIEWYNKEGKEGSLIEAIYGKAVNDLKIGSHHWNYPAHALVRQPTTITAINGSQVTIKDPLIHDIKPDWEPAMVRWEHLEEVGIEHLRIAFPMAPNIAHHIEEGYNGIYLTRLFNGWVNDVKIENADSGILTEEVANVTISNIETFGEKLAHYSVSMSGVHNVLVEELVVKNPVRHPLSFNTFSTRSVYTNCQVHTAPVLDQHSGANHQNLFDDIVVDVALKGNGEYPLFKGGGAGYWKPSHGAFTTFWNIEVRFQDGFEQPGPVLLNGMKDGPQVRLVGVYANREISVDYDPNPYMESINERIEAIPSLYRYQLKNRLKNKVFD